MKIIWLCQKFCVNDEPSLLLSVSIYLLRHPVLIYRATLRKVFNRTLSDIEFHRDFSIIVLGLHPGISIFYLFVISLFHSEEHKMCELTGLDNWIIIVCVTAWYRLVDSWGREIFTGNLFFSLYLTKGELRATIRKIQRSKWSACSETW